MESTPEQAAEGRALVTVLACVLEKLIQANANSGVSLCRRMKRLSFLVVPFVFSHRKENVLSGCEGKTRR